MGRDSTPQRPAFSERFWQDKTILLTGATGMVGSRLTQLACSAGAHVVALVRDQDRRSDFYRSGVCDYVTTVNGQLEDYSAIERAVNEHEVDTVIHLGAQTIVTTAERSPHQTFEVNIKGTYNVLEACRVHSFVKRI